MGRLAGQLKEVRAQNARLRGELKDAVAEAEERSMLMERIGHVEEELA